tara:strand:+ start:6344 stop:8038 length:1695 start_codon:yes stop_codon:yes gene_type:complete
MKIALAQLNPLIGDIKGNGDKILDSYEDTKNQNVDLILTPELSLWGYPPRDLLFDSSRYEEQIEVLNKITTSLSREFSKTSLLIGIAEKTQDRQLPNLFNSLVLVANGSWHVVARKQLLPTYDVFDEKRYFQSANSSSVIHLKTNQKNWTIGLTICEDLWVEEDLQKQRVKGSDPLEQLKENQIDLLVNLSASPFSYSKELVRHNLAQKACKRLHCSMIYLNQVGGNDELVFDGSSFVMNPQGEIIHCLPKCKESISIWDSSQKESIQLIPYSNQQENLFRSLVLGVKDYCSKCSFQSVLLGLSGGIDSALVAAIATAALDGEKINAVLMPSPWSSAGSIEDALELAKRLGMKTNIIPINNLMSTYESTLTTTLGELPKDITAENLQARIRGTLLMAIANQQNHLLLSTGNKSELAMGYCTLYGDMNGGLSVIGDLYKTSVFKLCNWLDSNQSSQCRAEMGLNNITEIIGSKIRNKAPSAELRKDQLDTDSLPPYDLLDPILKGIIEDRLNEDELIDLGYEKDLIQKISSSLKKAEFKRRQAPPLLKVSDQAFGSGWRIPIASK